MTLNTLVVTLTFRRRGTWHQPLNVWIAPCGAPKLRRHFGNEMQMAVVTLPTAGLCYPVTAKKPAVYWSPAGYNPRSGYWQRYTRSPVREALAISGLWVYTGGNSGLCRN